MVTDLKNNQDFQNAIATPGNKLIVVDFYATWCGPCKMVSPMVEKFSQEYTQADFYKIDVDLVPEAAQNNEVTAMPTFLFFKNGREISRIVGANPAGVKQAIAANI
ncbi:hypothetical protein TBLA_0B07550 [Henningerozyma blattae CBS 6284]|uniref:Thioredoxin n=1 Tax=Henningerozyma blattae (strain ATCC 34711 / CBS 6284 / DSM 70876 / NBRC 10599 / NRRL Y-10934 / UCD 77-7) TaxID=1071380 RepID=I2GZM0_HENB6|nr:hypothetical protein TBLA_0B07550 [Tetrapisispora blattae CBS 6284]CCH59572.1 hypothetical protein TBLA_0B07550 [Tetrapisispora blattae CBS 6284]